MSSEQLKKHQSPRATSPTTGAAPPSIPRAGSPLEGADQSTDERAVRERLILDAAERLLLRWGYRKTTVDDVAREAGVGKGTIYLHWKDKGAMFRAALWRASRQAIDAMLERLEDDPQGGQFHRLFAHGMVAVYAHPLLAAIMSGKSDIFRGLIGSFDPSTLNRLVGNTNDQVARLQKAGVIRADIPVNLVAFLMGAIKTGIISASEYTAPEQTPPTNELVDALADLMRRWLEPADGTGDEQEGRRILTEWMNEMKNIETTSQSTEE